MAKKTYTVTKTCSQCAGTGLVMQPPFQWIDENGNALTPTQISCPVCGGDGTIPWGNMTED
jgi:rRNA maturation protein Nop10